MCLSAYSVLLFRVGDAEENDVWYVLRTVFKLLA